MCRTMPKRKTKTVSLLCRAIHPFQHPDGLLLLQSLFLLYIFLNILSFITLNNRYHLLEAGLF